MGSATRPVPQNRPPGTPCPAPDDPRVEQAFVAVQAPGAAAPAPSGLGIVLVQAKHQTQVLELRVQFLHPEQQLVPGVLAPKVGMSQRQFVGAVWCIHVSMVRTRASGVNPSSRVHPLGRGATPSGIARAAALAARAVLGPRPRPDTGWRRLASMWLALHHRTRAWTRHVVTVCMPPITTGAKGCRGSSVFDNATPSAWPATLSPNLARDSGPARGQRIQGQRALRRQRPGRCTWLDFRGTVAGGARDGDAGEASLSVHLRISLKTTLRSGLGRERVQEGPSSSRCTDVRARMEPWAAPRAALRGSAQKSFGTVPRSVNPMGAVHRTEGGMERVRPAEVPEFFTYCRTDLPRRAQVFDS